MSEWNLKQRLRFANGAPLDLAQIRRTPPPGSYYDKRGNLHTPGCVNCISQGAESPGTRVINIDGKHVVLKPVAKILECNGGAAPKWEWKVAGVLEQNGAKPTGAAAQLLNLASQMRQEKHESWRVAAYDAAEEYIKQNFPNASYSYNTVYNLANWILAVKNGQVNDSKLNSMLEKVRESYYREKSYVDAINHKLNFPATGEIKLKSSGAKPDFASEAYGMFRGSAGPIAQFLASAAGGKPGIVHATPFTPPPPYANRKQYEEWQKKVHDYGLGKNLEIEAGHIAGLWLGLAEASAEGEVTFRVFGKAEEILAETPVGQALRDLGAFAKEKTARIWKPLANLKGKVGEWYENYALQHGLIRLEVEKVTLPADAEVHIQARGSMRALEYRFKGEVDVTDLYKTGLIPKEGRPGLIELQPYIDEKLGAVAEEGTIRVPYSPKFTTLWNKEGSMTGFIGPKGGSIFAETNVVTMGEAEGTYRINYLRLFQTLEGGEDDTINIIRFKGTGGNTPWTFTAGEEASTDADNQVLKIIEETGREGGGTPAIPRPNITYNVVKETPAFSFVKPVALSFPSTNSVNTPMTQLGKAGATPALPRPNLFFKIPEKTNSIRPTGFPSVNIIFTPPQQMQKIHTNTITDITQTLKLDTTQITQVSQITTPLTIPDITVPDIVTPKNKGTSGGGGESGTPMLPKFPDIGEIDFGFDESSLRDISKWFNPRKILGM